MISHDKKNDIDRIVLDALSKSNSLGVFPTPVDKIIKYADLRVNSHIDLSVIPNTFFAKQGLILKRGLAKIRGVLDRREKIIYLDLSVPATKIKFVKLHEAGHELLGWQGKLLKFLEDNDETLDPDINEEFESEANYFASSALFQLQLFTDKMKEYPLELATCLELSKLFGGSFHAAIRRYVENSPKRCALLILNKEKSGPFSPTKLTLRTYIQSPSFTDEWGMVGWGEEFEDDAPFVQNFLENRRLLKSQLEIDWLGEVIKCNYHYFHNGHNVFVFMFPLGESVKSRTNFVVKY
ncbi:hypothetical protein FHW88_000390 [Mucilaginibacter sp. SG538B]|uniref:ImmA/IrrE family metallo-endopeptidase n=1 Tax=Mucilaginibacter sp. SG538B TaxID=2587021 RepID=UPI00159D75FA|nr:ImmA/IrrE family metallo-endopeptidase [Mucilaginibacter sp. SG538B]NVM62114.1 hypothetical protein [Mucilaginibacter sp. SG538B]